MQEGPLRAAGAHDQADRAAGDHAVQMGASGRGAVRAQSQLAKCESEQARAKQDKTADGHSEETVRSEFFAHGTPPTARKSDCQQDQLHTFAAIAGSHLPLRRRGESQVENIIRQSSISGPPRASLRLATCNRPFQISTETRTIEIDGSILRRYASDTERVSGESYGGLARAGERDLARSGSG
jgi:hypothetical protein